MYMHDNPSAVIAAGAAQRRHGDCQSNRAEGYPVWRVRGRQDVYISALRQ